MSTGTGAITSYIDVAQLVLYAFWIFFFGLILYLRREDKREGYPLESDRSKYIRVVGFPDMPPPKEFILPHNGGTRMTPRVEPERPPLAAEPVAPWPGAPLQPTGNPLVDGVGPAAYAIRPNEPDLTHEGVPKIVPMRVATDYFVHEKDPDPRGKPVYGADGEIGGKVTDIWVDRSEPQIRYLEMDVEGRQVLLPINYVRMSKDGQRVKVVSILGRHFAEVPTLSNPDQITLQEEDRVCAYYAGGHLYALPHRSEPLL
ncbi:MAG: photosynthetic reaction center subunit H [Chromatiales bacterium]|jgi:photosynthetic reaction center H subunit